MFVNNSLNLFAISQFSVISFRPSLKKVGNCFLGGDLDIINRYYGYISRGCELVG